MKKMTKATTALSLFAVVSAMGLTVCVTKGGDNKGGDDPSRHTTHSYAEIVISPTCTEQGYTLHKCECGEEYKDNYVNATGIHTFKTYVYNNDATCVTVGTETATCENCDDIGFE